MKALYVTSSIIATVVIVVLIAITISTVLYLLAKKGGK